MGKFSKNKFFENFQLDSTFKAGRVNFWLGNFVFLAKCKISKLCKFGPVRGKFAKLAKILQIFAKSATGVAKIFSKKICSEFFAPKLAFGSKKLENLAQFFCKNWPKFDLWSEVKNSYEFLTRPGQKVPF